MKVLALGLIAASLQAQSLDQVRTCLKTLAGKVPLVIQAERQSWSRELKKGALPEQGWVKAQLEAGPSGLRVVSGSESANIPAKGGENPRPLGDREMAQVLEAAGELTKTLAEARLESEASEIRNGRPSKHFRFSLPLEDEAEARKHMKEAWHALDLWVEPDGTPLASLEAFQIRGRVMFMTVEAGAKIHREYQKVGDRLVMMSEKREMRGAGMGQGSEGRTLLQVVPLNIQP